MTRASISNANNTLRVNPLQKNIKLFVGIRRFISRSLPTNMVFYTNQVFNALDMSQTENNIWRSDYSFTSSHINSYILHYI